MYSRERAMENLHSCYRGFSGGEMALARDVHFDSTFKDCFREVFSSFLKGNQLLTKARVFLHTEKLSQFLNPRWQKAEPQIF